MLSAGRAGTVGWRSAACSPGQFGRGRRYLGTRRGRVARLPRHSGSRPGGGLSGQCYGRCRLSARLPAILGTVGAHRSGVAGARAGHRPARRALLEGHRGGGQPHDWRGRRWAPLTAHRWPGDVRELQDVLADITVTGPRYGAVGSGALPAALRKRSAPSDSRRSPKSARTSNGRWFGTSSGIATSPAPLARWASRGTAPRS